MFQKIYKQFEKLSKQKQFFQLFIQKRSLKYSIFNSYFRVSKSKINLNYSSQLFFYSKIQSCQLISGQFKQYFSTSKQEKHNQRENSLDIIDNIDIDSLSDYSDEFLQQLMNKNFIKNSILKIMDQIILDFQLNNNQKLKYSAQSQQFNQNNNENTKNQQKQKNLQQNQRSTLIKIKFLAYVYHLYPKQANINIFNIIASQYFMSKVQEAQNSNCFEIINNFQGFLKFLYQSQFYKGNHQKIRHSLNNYNHFLLKCSEIMLKQFNEIIQKKIQGRQNEQDKKKLENIFKNYRNLIFAFPFYKLEPKKQSSQQNSLIMILNQPYLKLINNFFKLVKILNKTWIKQSSQTTNKEFQQISYTNLLKQSFHQYTTIYKYLTETILMIIQHEYQRYSNFNRSTNNQKNSKSYNNPDIFNFQFSLLFNQNTLVCENEIQFIRVLHLLEHFMSFSLFRKINFKKVNIFYNKFLKLNLNQNSKIAKNQQMKNILWNHLSKHSIYMNFDILDLIKSNQIQLA